MLKEERYDKIIEILDEEAYISAESLAAKLFVSMPTVRRDLAELHRRGRIIRSHGGAKAMRSEQTVSPLNFRKTQNKSEKRRICRAAASLISDNDLIFIDASTTALQIADFLAEKKHVTVITNGIPLSLLLTEKGIKNLCTGGEIQPTSLGYAGGYAEEMIRKFNFDVMLFSSYGISDEGMITDASEAETILRRMAAKSSAKRIFLCDHTKLSRSAPYNLLPIEDADIIITDKTEHEDDFFKKLDKDKIIFA